MNKLYKSKERNHNDEYDKYIYIQLYTEAEAQTKKQSKNRMMDNVIIGQHRNSDWVEKQKEKRGF